PWPHDVLVDGAKSAGILLESSGSADGSVAWLVLGCGVNIADAPRLADNPATGLHAAGAEGVSAGGLLGYDDEAFDGWRRRWQNGGIAPVREAWLARAQGLGEQIRVRLPDGEIHGCFAGMDGEGALLLETGPGVRRTVTAGDVFF
ncbi:MAG: biotin--[acetyl-CoA-carboxylase] ligase, partial [Acetobacteraceae bacterium]